MRFSNVSQNAGCFCRIRPHARPASFHAAHLPVGFRSFEHQGGFLDARETSIGIQFREQIHLLHRLRACRAKASRSSHRPLVRCR